MKKINGHILAVLAGMDEQEKGTAKATEPKKRHFLPKAITVGLATAAVIGGLAVGSSLLVGCDTTTGPEITNNNNGDEKVYDANGWNIKNPADLINGTTGTQYDKEGYDRAGYNEVGWNREHKNKTTGTIYDNRGYKENGYNEYGWNINGENENGTLYDNNGFRIDGTYMDTGSPYNDLGYDRNGYDINGYNRDGYDRDGYDVDGWHQDPTDKTNKNGTEYDNNGVDRDGYDVDGWNTKDPNDKMNKNGTLYDDNDHDRDGNPKPPPEIEDIAAFNFAPDTTNVTFFTRFGLNNQHYLSNFTKSEVNGGGP